MWSRSSKHRPFSDTTAWSQYLGISQAALDLYLSSDVIDLHIDTFIWTRLFGYDPCERHGPGLLGARYFSQVDIPRLCEARISGGVHVITTNPFRTAAGRARAFVANVQRLHTILASSPQVAIVRSAEEYKKARAQGKHAAFLGIQGANALTNEEAREAAARNVVLATLVHLTPSRIGTPSVPIPFVRRKGLSTHGNELIEWLNSNHILVDLAHINREGFFDALHVHDRSLPLIVSHTGCSGVYQHWRNIDDEQIRAVAEQGGIIGVIYACSFLGKGTISLHRIVDHLEHIVRTVGEDHAALGSDWDGAIVTPRDMPTCLELPRLVQTMLDRGFSERAITKILGQNFLRVLSEIRSA